MILERELPEDIESINETDLGSVDDNKQNELEELQMELGDVQAELLEAKQKLEADFDLNRTNREMQKKVFELGERVRALAAKSEELKKGMKN